MLLTFKKEFKLELNEVRHYTKKVIKVRYQVVHNNEFKIFIYLSSTKKLRVYVDYIPTIETHICRVYDAHTSLITIREHSTDTPYKLATFIKGIL